MHGVFRVAGTFRQIVGYGYDPQMK